MISNDNFNNICKVLNKVIFFVNKIKKEDNEKFNILWSNLENDEYDILFSYIYINFYNLMEAALSESIYFTFPQNKPEPVNVKYLKTSFSDLVKDKKITGKEIKDLIQNRIKNKDMKETLLLFCPSEEKVFDSNILETLFQKILTLRIEFAHPFYNRDKITIYIKDYSLNFMKDIFAIYFYFIYSLQEYAVFHYL